MPDWSQRWREVADGVLVRRHRALDLNCSLVLGDDRALLVDTHAHAGFALDLLAAVRRATALPLVVVNTHAHFDHCFGNATVLDAEPDTPVWGHVGCRAGLLGTGEAQRRAAAAWMTETRSPRADAEAVLAVRIAPPAHTFSGDHVLDLGGRRVHLAHPGAGHTDHDTVVHVGGASVSLVGDLVEEGAPPAFEDADPLAWPLTLRALLPALGAVVVPGHGDVVDRGFVEEQTAALEAVAAAVRGLADEPSQAELLAAAVRLPVGRHPGLVALRRALALRRRADPPAG